MAEHHEDSDGDVTIPDCFKILEEFMKGQEHVGMTDIFLKPVETDDYHEIIKKPMDLKTIKQKLHTQKYNRHGGGGAQGFKDDMDLMLDNCNKYNPRTSPYNFAGREFRKRLNEKWEDAKEKNKKSARQALDDPSTDVSSDIDYEVPDSDTEQDVSGTEHEDEESVLSELDHLPDETSGSPTATETATAHPPEPMQRDLLQANASNNPDSLLPIINEEQQVKLFIEERYSRWVKSIQDNTVENLTPDQFRKLYSLIVERQFYHMMKKKKSKELKKKLVKRLMKMIYEQAGSCTVERVNKCMEEAIMQLVDILLVGSA